MAKEHLGSYLYVSRRLVSQIIARHDAHAPAVVDLESMKGTLGGGPAKLETSFRVRPEPDTVERLAARASEILDEAGLIGTLLEPHRPYVRMRLDAYLSLYGVDHGFQDSAGATIAAVTASQTIEGVGRVFVALFGSQTNYTGHRSNEAVRPVSGWNPSDMNGLYSLFDRVRELADPAPTERRVSTESGISDEEVVRQAASIALGDHVPPPLRRVEILAQRFTQPIAHIVIDDRHTEYDLALVGAPLWIREVVGDDSAVPAPPAIDVLGGGPTLFDEHRLATLTAYENLRSSRRELRLADLEAQRSSRRPTAAEQHGGDDGLPALRQRASDAEHAAAACKADAYQAVTRPEEFEALVRWFTSQARHAGMPFTYLSVIRRPPWYRRVWDRDWKWANPPERSDLGGYVVTVYPGNGSGPAREVHVLVTETGHLYRVTVDSVRRDPRARVVYWPPTGTGSWALPRGHVPQPDPQLQLPVAAELFRSALIWRVSLHREEPEAPWVWTDNTYRRRREIPHELK